MAVQPFRLACLVFLFQLLHLATTTPRLRIRGNTAKSSESILRTNRNVTVDCIECSSAVWKVEEGCEIITNHSTQLVFRCKASGFKVVTVTTEQKTTDMRLHFVRDDYHCFAWTACVLNNLQGCKLREFLIEPGDITNNQVQVLLQLESVEGSTASPRSKEELTQSLVEMGELPEVSVLHRRLFTTYTASPPQYSRELKGWMVALTIPDTEVMPGLPVTVRIQGRTSFLMGCFVQKRDITFFVEKFPRLSTNQSLQTALNSVDKVINDPCAWNLFYAIDQTSSVVLFSRREEKTVVEFDAFEVASSQVIDVAPVRQGIYLLDGSDIFRLMYDVDSPVLVASGVNVDRISSARSCRGFIDQVNDIVVAWNGVSASVLYLLTSTEQGFTPLSLGSALHVLDVAPLFGPPLLFLLSQENDHEVHAMQYDLHSHGLAIVETITNLTSLPNRYVPDIFILVELPNFA